MTNIGQIPKSDMVEQLDERINEIEEMISGYKVKTKPSIIDRAYTNGKKDGARDALKILMKFRKLLDVY